MSLRSELKEPSHFMEFFRQSDFVRVDEVHEGETQKEVFSLKWSSAWKPACAAGESRDLLCERRVQQGDVRQL